MLADSLTKKGYPARGVLERFWELHSCWRIVHDEMYTSQKKRRQQGVYDDLEHLEATENVATGICELDAESMHELFQRKSDERDEESVVNTPVVGGGGGLNTKARTKTSNQAKRVRWTEPDPEMADRGQTAEMADRGQTAESFEPKGERASDSGALEFSSLLPASAGTPTATPRPAKTASTAALGRALNNLHAKVARLRRSGGSASPLV